MDKASMVSPLTSTSSTMIGSCPPEKRKELLKETQDTIAQIEKELADERDSMQDATQRRITQEDVQRIKTIVHQEQSHGQWSK